MPDMSRINAPSPTVQARHQFKEANLRFPPLPSELEGRLRFTFDDDDAGGGVYATRELEFGPYHLEGFVSELVQRKNPGDYAVIGFDGHGTNSWAVHYILVQPGLALFLQIAWGGAYDDPEESRSSIEAAWKWAEAIQGAVERNLAKSALAAGWRLAVVRSEFGRSKWAWMPPASTEKPQEPNWHYDFDGASVFEDSTNSLGEVLQGKVTFPL